jgi:large subunit ribosomal protein L13
MKKTRKNKEYQPSKWHHVNAEGVTLGRLASQVATLLRGKHKVDWTPNLCHGDGVVVTNASLVKVTGNKESQKEYVYHTGYPGGLNTRTLGQMRESNADLIIKKAVWGMLPKNHQGRKSLKRLKIYTGAEHPHSAQKPKEFEIR